MSHDRGGLFLEPAGRDQLANRGGQPGLLRGALGGPRRTVLVDVPPAHHEDDPAQRGGIGQRVAVERDDVRLQSGRDGADPVLHAQRLGGERGGRDHRVHRILPALLDVGHQLVGVRAVAARVGIGAVHDPHAGGGRRGPEEGEGAGPRRLQVGESFERVAPDAGVAVAALLIVAEEQVDLVAQIHAALDEHADVPRLEQPAVLHLGAPGVGGQPQRVGPVQMDDRPQALGSRLPAGGLELGGGQVGDPAEADARRREDLDDVGAGGGPVAHVLPDLVRRPGVLAHRPERRQQPRPRNLAAVDPRLQLGVFRRAQALHRGDPVHQRAVRVLGAVQRHVGAAGVVLVPVDLAVGVEVVPNVDVGVDVARQHGQGREVVDAVAAALAARNDVGDSPVAHDQVAVLQHGAPPVENAGRAQHRRLPRRLSQRRCHRPRTGQSQHHGNHEQPVFGTVDAVAHGLLQVGTSWMTGHSTLLFAGP